MIWKQKSWVSISSFPFTIWEILGKPLKFASKNVDHNIYSVFLSKRCFEDQTKGWFENISYTAKPCTNIVVMTVRALPGL